MINIFGLTEKPDKINQLSNYVWSKWGTKENFNFYNDCMAHSLTSNDVPKFYFAADGVKVVACYAILRNELVARQDLTPWFACLFVEPEYRGNKIGSKLLDHATAEAKKFGYKQLYLSTSLENYYEKYNWNHVADSFYFNGDLTKIYIKEV